MTDLFEGLDALDRALAEALMTPEGRADPYPHYASVREATRLRRLASEPQADDGDQGGNGAALASAGSGGAGAGSSAG